LPDSRRLDSIPFYLNSSPVAQIATQIEERILLDPTIDWTVTSLKNTAKKERQGITRRTKNKIRKAWLGYK
jgi:hypothetical protein